MGSFVVCPHCGKVIEIFDVTKEDIVCPWCLRLIYDR